MPIPKKKTNFLKKVTKQRAMPKETHISRITRQFPPSNKLTYFGEEGDEISLKMSTPPFFPSNLSMHGKT